MSTHYAPGSPEFLALFDSFQRYAWRLETLQTYGASGEDERLARFRRGEPYRHTEAKQRWLDTIRAAHARGATVGRVHVVAEPLSEYMRYELSWGYAPNVAAGEDIRILPRGESARYRQDFWLFDDRLYLMHYAQDGTWLDVERVDDPRHAAAAAESMRVTLARAEPYRQYMSRNHPDLLDRAAAA